MDRQAVQERFGIIGPSAELARVIDRVRQVARTDITVLLEGESGVGKELFATALHELSGRRHGALVVVNCGAIPEGLIEAELFGAEKGAYTGSVERRTGYFEEADGGSIFLDEIGELPLQAQVRLLRVLEGGTFSRVGSSLQQRADARTIAATNKDLAREVAEGRFREDLYYRLSTVVIRIPPLRERKEDILPTFEHFLYRFAQRYDAPLRRLDSGAKELLLRYAWPGNVRELRNAAEQAAVLLRTETATAEDLRPFLRGISASQGLTVASRPGALGPSAEARERELIYRVLLELRLEVRELKDMLRRLAGGAPLPASPYGLAELEDHEEFGLLPEDDPHLEDLIEDVPYEIESDEEAEEALDRAIGPPEEEHDPEEHGPEEHDPEEEATALRIGHGPLPTMEEAEQVLITEALRRFDGNRRQTARALGISERTLYRKLKDLEAQGVEV